MSYVQVTFITSTHSYNFFVASTLRISLQRLGRTCKPRISANIIPLFFATISRSNARWQLPYSMFWVQTARNTGYITCWPLILRRSFGQIYFRRLSSLPINFTPVLVCDEVGQLPDPNCAKGLLRSHPSSSSSQQVSRRSQAFPLSSLRSPLRILCRAFRSTMNDSIIVFNQPARLQVQD